MFKGLLFSFFDKSFGVQQLILQFLTHDSTADMESVAYLQGGDCMRAHYKAMYCCLVIHLISIIRTVHAMFMSQKFGVIRY